MKPIVAAVGILMLLVTGCSSGLDRPVQEATAEMGSDRVQRVSVKTHSFYFEPNRIVVTRGIPVELTVKNGAFFIPHNFSCLGEDAGFQVDQKVGMFHDSETVRFTPTRAGEYPFRCNIDGHAGKGMLGTLVVVEP
jgi:plastocyanin